MTTRTRPDSRRDYRHFPQEYATLLHQFAARGHVSLGPLAHSDALAARRDLYRYRAFLSAALDEDPSDDNARELFAIFNRVVLRVESVEAVEVGFNGVVKSLPLTYQLTFNLNPLIAAMEAAARQEGNAS